MDGRDALVEASGVAGEASVEDEEAVGGVSKHGMTHQPPLLLLTSPPMHHDTPHLCSLVSVLVVVGGSGVEW